MAGSSRYTVVLDACVLYPAPVRDLLLSLAEVGLYHARWTDAIQREWVSHLATNRPDIPLEKLQRTTQLMSKAIPDSNVIGYESLIASLILPDPDDRHVLAAAIVGHADAIVTFNSRDFPGGYLAQFGIETQHPDDFITNQFELHELSAVAAMKGLRQRLRSPPQSVDDLLNTFERVSLPQTASYLRRAEIARLI